MPNILLLGTYRPSYGPELPQYMNHAYAVKFIYSEKATKFCEIFTLRLSYVVLVKSKAKISQNFVALSEYMNFKGLPASRASNVPFIEKPAAAAAAAVYSSN